MAPPKLPVIDLNVKNLNPASSSWIKKCNEVMGALEEYGCFIATYDGVSHELDDAIFLEARDLFDLPTEVKVLNTSHKRINHIMVTMGKFRACLFLKA